MATPRENARIIVTAAVGVVLSLGGLGCVARAFSADAPIKFVVAAGVLFGLGAWVALHVHRAFISTHPRANAVPSNQRWRGPRGVVCLAPRARETVCARVASQAALGATDELRSTSVRPGASAGPSASPLEVTSGRLSAAKSMEELRLTTSRCELGRAWSSCRRLRSTQQCACGRAAIELGARAQAAPLSWAPRACGAARQARIEVLEAPGARLTRRLCRVRLRRWGRTRTVPLDG
jgi:hypothetical protein